MSNVRWFASRDEVVAHVATPSIEIEWDEGRGLVRFRAPIDVALDSVSATDVALMVSRINMSLPLLLLELRETLAFTTHLFLDEDGRVSSTAIDLCTATIAQCEARTKLELDTLREPSRA